MLLFIHVFMVYTRTPHSWYIKKPVCLRWGRGGKLLALGTLEYWISLCTQVSPQGCKMSDEVRGRGRPAAQRREGLWAVPTLQHWFTFSDIVKIRNPRILELRPAVWIFKCIWDLDGRREAHSALRHHHLVRLSFKPQNTYKNLDLCHWKHLRTQLALLLWQENVSWWFKRVLRSEYTGICWVQHGSRRKRKMPPGYQCLQQLLLDSSSRICQVPYLFDDLNWCVKLKRQVDVPLQKSAKCN